MNINVSLNTDIIALNNKWFLNRLCAGFFDIEEPKRIMRYNFKFFADLEKFNIYTKSPMDLYYIIKDIKDFRYNFKFFLTYTPYEKFYEPNLKNKDKFISYTTKLAKTIHKSNIFIHYGPIFINDVTDIEYHINQINYLTAMCKNCFSGFVFDFRPPLTSSTKYHINTLTVEQKQSFLDNIKRDKNLKYEELTINPLDIDMSIKESCRLGCLYCPSISNHNKAYDNTRHINSESTSFIPIINKDLPIVEY